MSEEFKEFTAADLTALGSMGIWPNPAYIMARFLETVRNNLHNESLRQIYETRETFDVNPWV